jgi:hypothetical protein
MLLVEKETDPFEFRQRPAGRRSSAGTVPRDPAFSRANARWTPWDMGAAPPARLHLGIRKGCAFVGTNRAENNAFFVKKSRLPTGWKEPSVEEGFTPPQFQEARNERGQLSYAPSEEAAKLIAGLPLVEVAE